MNDSFTAKVYALVRQIPSGKVATYRDIAVGAGSPRAMRAAGMAMRNNPDPAGIPCHRVVGTDGKLHGYAFGGLAAKRAKLLDEGVSMKGERVDLVRSRWTCDT